MLTLSLAGVLLRPPREDEYGFMIELRNRERRWFGDESELDHAVAAAWLATRDDEDQLLCIESGAMVVGTIGWTRVQAPGLIYELGRTIGDYRSARRGACDPVQLRKAIRIAIYLVLNHLFQARHASVVYARNKPENEVVKKLMLGFEGRASTWPFSSSSQGLETWRIEAGDWPVIGARVLKRIHMATDVDSAASGY